MRESSTYQAILRKGRIEALQKTLLRIGRQRFGVPSEVVQARVTALTDEEQLERLTERLLAVSTCQEHLEAP
jgi:hypothetical protein